MKIDSIFIENIRSHVKTYIKFSKGFNCLVGGLGAGKSSILYAIDFALFGEPLSRSYDYLLREGTDIGRVALKFIENGKEYTIWRGLRRRGERISQDPEQLKLFEGSKLLAEMKSDAVSEQLKSIIGVDREIFRDIIWVRQEKLKEILDIMPAERQRRLDQLFGISDYDISWANLRPVQRWYEGERETLERDPDVIGVKDMQSKYDEAVKELSIREAELEEAHRSLYEAELKLKEASSRLEGLMEMRRKSEEMRNEEADLKSKIGSLESICARLMNEIRERRAKINDLETRLEALNAQEKNVRRRLADLGLSENMSLEDLQSYIDSIIVQISSIRGEEENVRGEIRRATQRISNLVKESRCPLCLQNLLSEYKDKLMKQLNEEISSYRQQLSELERSAKELEHLRSILFAALTSLQSILPKREELTRQLRDEEQQLKRAVEELNAKKEEIEILKSRLTDLKSKIAEFDYSKLEEAQRLYSETLERYSNLKYKVQNLESQKNEIISRLEGLKIRLDIAQKKIERLEKIREILVFIEETRQAYKSIQPKIRGDFVKYLERIVQQIMDELIGSEGELFTIKIDENYT
ncbi:MAG: SMC family ATPase, partial [Candidatus Bathyarchaeia archaeon]